LSLIDLAFISLDLALSCDWSVLDDPLGSDHFPCVTSLCEKVIFDSTSVDGWCYARANWVAFKEDCSREITDEVVDPLDPTGSYSRLFTALDNIPKTNTHNNKIKKVMYWNEECSQAVKNRNKAKNHMLATKDLDDCIVYRRLKGVAQHVIKS